MPKLDKALRREAKQHKRKHGMRVVGRSVKILRDVLDKKSKV